MNLTSKTELRTEPSVLCAVTPLVLEYCISVCSLFWLPSPPICRRLDPSERPLQMVYDYLTAMGYEDPLRVQQEAANSDLSCMIRFYSGELWASFSLNAGTASSIDRPKSQSSVNNLLALQSKLFESTRAVVLFRIRMREILPAVLNANATVKVQISVFVYNPFPYSLFGLTALEWIMGFFSHIRHQCVLTSVLRGLCLILVFSSVTQRIPITLLFRYPSCTSLFLIMWLVVWECRARLKKHISKMCFSSFQFL